MERETGYGVWPYCEFLLVAIVAILLFFALEPNPSWLRGPAHRNQAKIAATEADLATMQNAIQSFRHDYGRYPTEAEGLEALRVAPKGIHGWVQPYLSTPLSSDPWGHSYIYLIPGPNGTPFGVES